MNESHFEHIANSFTVKEIASPVLSVNPDWTEVDLARKLNYPASFDALVIVNEENRHLGYVALSGEVRAAVGLIQLGFVHGKPRLLKDIAKPITTEMLFSSNTPLLDAIPLFKKNQRFFLLTKNQITHTVTFQDVDKLPFKLSLVTLTIELESQILKLFDALSLKCAYADDPMILPKFLYNLPERKLKLAKNLWKRKYKGESDYGKITNPIKQVPWDVLRCTYFSDKVLMLGMLGTASSLLSLSDLGFSGKKEFSKFSETIRELRNEVVHGGSILRVVERPSQLSEVIKKVRSLSRKLHKISTREHPHEPPYGE